MGKMEKGGLYIDNRNQDDMTSYHESRIEVLLKRIKELEEEKRVLETVIRDYGGLVDTAVEITAKRRRGARA